MSTTALEYLRELVEKLSREATIEQCALIEQRTQFRKAITDELGLSDATQDDILKAIRELRANGAEDARQLAEALKERDVARAARDEALAWLGVITAARDEARVERSKAWRERDEVRAERDVAMATLKAMTAEHNELQAEREGRDAECHGIEASERFALKADIRRAVDERDQAQEDYERLTRMRARSTRDRYDF